MLTGGSARKTRRVSRSEKGLSLATGMGVCRYQMHARCLLPADPIQCSALDRGFCPGPHERTRQLLPENTLVSSGHGPAGRSRRDSGHRAGSLP